MATEAPTPLPQRPSTADRRRIARLLERRSADGSISLNTFAARVERASTARSRAELADLVADVRKPSPVRRRAMRAVGWLSALAADLESAWRAPRTPILALPASPARLTTIGRSPECDCIVGDPTVSRRHAQLHRQDERWIIRDLGSRNGTWVNGMRVTEETEVRPGDRISFGTTAFHLRCVNRPAG
jgi:hypothetical protein